MQSNNPVFRRSEEFNSAGSTRQGYGQAGYTDPSTWGTGTPGQPGVQAPVAATTGPMTIDSVVQKTALSLGVVILTAAATWILSPEVTQDTAASALPGLLAAATIGSLGAFALSLVNSFKRVISPALVLLFCAFEGVALGAISKLFNIQFPGVVTGAVLGTFGAFAGTLAVYKFFDIKVGTKFRNMVIGAVFGMVALSVIELVLGMFGASLGLFGMGGAGLLFAIIGLVLGVFMLVLDFDFIEQGVANGIPERESWRAAFGLTVSLIWIYTNLLRILAIFGDN
jgi:uncharacterized YccA/Bax inhibitor family protein